MSDTFPRPYGRYQLIERLAIGGMAELFLATVSGAEGFEKTVVIKRLLPDLAGDEQFRSMFIDEAKITARLVHPKIAQTYELGRLDDELYIAMEYVDGIDGLSLLREQAHQGARTPAPIVAFIIMEVLDALDFAHNQVDAQGRASCIVHRDVSPSNVLLSRRGNVKLVDFGIARAVEEEQRTRAGTLKGKYGYMSPEHVVGKSLDARSDVFSAGIVMAEMLMGRRLFAAPNELDVLLMVRDAKLDRLDRYGADVDPDLNALLRRALSKNRDERFASAAEFREHLDEWLFARRLRVTPKEIAELVQTVYDAAQLRRRNDLASLREPEPEVAARRKAVAPTARLAVDAAPAAAEESARAAREARARAPTVRARPDSAEPEAAEDEAYIDGIPSGEMNVGDSLQLTIEELDDGQDLGVADGSVPLDMGLGSSLAEGSRSSATAGLEGPQPDASAGVGIAGLEPDSSVGGGVADLELEPSGDDALGGLDLEPIAENALPPAAREVPPLDLDAGLDLDEGLGVGDGLDLELGAYDGAAAQGAAQEAALDDDLEGIPIIEQEPEVAAERLAPAGSALGREPRGAVPRQVADVPEQSIRYSSIADAVAAVSLQDPDPSAIDFDDSEVSAPKATSASRSRKIRLPTADELAAVPEPVPPELSEVTEAPDQAGDLIEVHPLRVFYSLLSARATGMLRLEVGAIRKDVYMRDGEFEFVSSNVAKELFGEYLVSQGAISDGELSMALAMMPHYGGKMGDTLVGLGLLKPLEVFRYLSRQVRDKLVDVCSWTKGTFTWYDGRETTREAFTLDLDAFQVLGMGALVVPDEHIVAWGRRELHRKPRAVPNSHIQPERFQLGDEVTNVLSMLDGEHAVVELRARYDDARKRAHFLRILHLLIQTELAI